MDCTGKLVNVTKDWKTGQFQLTFAINETPDIESIQDCEKLNIKATKYRAKRSLDANAYAWVLITKIAEVIKSSKEEVYESLLQKYGALYQDSEGYVTVTVPKRADLSPFNLHLKKIKDSEDFSAYLVIKGSSQYDTKEMSTFIDGIVSECKELGIETLTVDELERIKTAWIQ